MEPFRFVHAADLHIDSPFKGLREVNPAIAKRLRESTYEAFMGLVRFCLDVRADFLLIAGDVYDGADRSVRAQFRFREGVARLAEFGVHTFVAHGNHDPLDGWQSSLEQPDTLHTFGPEPEWIDAERDGVPIAQIQGVSYPTREVRDNLAREFTPPRRKGLFSIGLLHCNVGGNTGHDDYAPCSIDDLVDTGIDYWALGHVHAAQQLSSDRPYVVYPGCIQGRHPNEPGERGCYLVDVGPEGGSTLTFHPLDVVRWERRSVDIAEAKNVDGVLETIGRAVQELRVEAGGRDAICRLALTGRGPMHAELARDESALGALLEDTRREAGLASPWAWIEDLHDRTRPDIDLARRAEQDDFLGMLLQRAEHAMEDDERLAELSAPVAEEYARRVNAGLLEQPSDDDVRDWLDAARWLLSERLESGGE